MAHHIRLPFEHGRTFKILDPCTGIGILRYAGQDILGVDVSATEVDRQHSEIGTKLYPRWTWMHCNAFYANLTLNSFDIVVANPPYNFCNKMPEPLDKLCKNQGGTARAEAEAKRVHADIAIAFNEIRREVETAWQLYKTNRDQLSIYRAPEGLKVTAEEAVAVAWLEYRIDVSGCLDLLSARRLLQETEQSYLQALFEGTKARVRLDRAIASMPAMPRTGIKSSR